MQRNIDQKIHAPPVNTSLNLQRSEMTCRTQIQHSVLAFGDLTKKRVKNCLLRAETHDGLSCVIQSYATCENEERAS